MTRDNNTARISNAHARSDGKGFADQLRDGLEKAGLRQWQDLEAMKRSNNWWGTDCICPPQKGSSIAGTWHMTQKALAPNVVRKECPLACRAGQEGVAHVCHLM